MKKITKLTSLLLVAVIILALAACSGTKKEDFKEWFSSEFSPAFDEFAQTDYAKENLPMPSLSMIVGSVDRLDSVLGFISEGKQPEGAEIKEDGNNYKYITDEYNYTVEINPENSALKITSELEFLGEKRTEFTVTLREYKNEYFIQYFSPGFNDYFEIRFTKDSGSVMRNNAAEIPCDIFNDKVSDNFAEEK